MVRSSKAALVLIKDEAGSLARIFFRQRERAVKMSWVRFTHDAAHSNRLWGAGTLANILLAVDERYIGL